MCRSLSLIRRPIRSFQRMGRPLAKLLTRCRKIELFSYGGKRHLAIRVGWSPSALQKRTPMQKQRMLLAARNQARSAVFTILPLLVVAVPASAQSVADFYRGKTITMAVGTSPGGDYDLRMRMVARHIGKHIPGKPEDRAHQYAWRRRDAGRQLACQRGAEGRHRHRGDLAIPGSHPGNRRRGRQIRRAPIQLDRQHHRFAECHQFVAHHRHPHHRRT